MGADIIDRVLRKTMISCVWTLEAGEEIRGRGGGRRKPRIHSSLNSSLARPPVMFVT